jgi:hypothetical protein
MKTYTAPFAQTPQSSQVVLTAASVVGTGDTPTNTMLTATAGSDGALCTAVSFTPRATMAAGVAYLFASNDSGTTQRLIGAVNISAQTISTTAAPTSIAFAVSETTPLRMKAGERIYVGASVVPVAGIVVDTRWTDF